MLDSKQYALYEIPEQDFRKANDTRKFVRAFIANTSMPKSIWEVLEEGLEENYFESNRFDIEIILQGNAESSWTVPKWAKPGDIIMFMLAKTSDYAVKRLGKEYAEKTG